MIPIEHRVTTNLRRNFEINDVDFLGYCDSSVQPVWRIVSATTPS
jgi:hypothetical protein